MILLGVKRMQFGGAKRNLCASREFLGTHSNLQPEIWVALPVTLLIRKADVPSRSVVCSPEYCSQLDRQFSLPLPLRPSIYPGVSTSAVFPGFISAKYVTDCLWCQHYSAAAVCSF